MTSVGQQVLTCDIVDGMVLDLFSGWQHKEWFWRNEQEHTHEHLIRRSILRTCQLKRARHRDQAVLSWSPSSEIGTLCLGALVLGHPDELVCHKEGHGLYKALAEHWAPEAINQIFSWVNTERGVDYWARCEQKVRQGHGVLQQTPFSVIEHLSSPLQHKLTMLRSLGIMPSYELLSMHRAPGVDSTEKIDLDILL